MFHAAGAGHGTIYFKMLDDAAFYAANSMVEEQFVLTTDPSAMVAVRTALQNNSIDYESADVEFVSSMPIQVDADTARKVIKLIDALEDSDEVQNVYSNFDMSAEVMAELEND